MLKGSAVTSTITIIGFAVIGALTVSRIPGMIEDIQLVLSKTSVIEKAAEVADLMSIANSDDVKISYRFPEEVNYKLSASGGYVNVSTEEEWAISKTTSLINFGPDAVSSILISKSSIEKVE